MRGDTITLSKANQRDVCEQFEAATIARGKRGPDSATEFGVGAGLGAAAGEVGTVGGLVGGLLTLGTFCWGRNAELPRFAA